MTTTSAEVVRTAYSQIAVSLSGKCLDIAGSSPADGAALIQYDCSSKVSQFWTIQRFKKAYRVINQHSKRCLAVDGAATAAGAAIVQSTCTGAGTGQLWSVTGSTGPYRLTAVHSSLCLTVTGASRDNGAGLTQESCAGAASSKRFDVLDGLLLSTSEVNLINRLSGRFAAVQNGSTALGAPVIQAASNGGASEQWRLEPRGASTYQVVSVNSGKCLVVDGGAPVQDNCNGNPNELWTPRATGKSYRLSSPLNGKCLNLAGTPANALALSTCSTASSQQWSLAVATAPAVWSSVIPFSLVPVAVANLPNGKILAWSSFDPMTFFPAPWPDANTYTQVYDPSQPASASNPSPLVDVTNTKHDMFCPGTANLSDGRILVNGGNNDNDDTSIYDSVSDSWIADAPMNIGRGYPGSTPLSNGNVFTLGGSWNGDPVNFPKNGEVWSSGTPAGLWTDIGVPIDPFFFADTSGASSGDNHFWMFAADDGWVFHAGPSPHMHWVSTSLAGGTTVAAGDRGDDHYSINGNAAMYDIGRILKLGGAIGYKNGDPASTSSYVIDIRKGRTAPVTVTKVAPMGRARVFAESVVLPNGQVVVVGGSSIAAIFVDGNAVFGTEIWDPVTQVFTPLPAIQVPRTYHSVALLLADGRVLSAGGGLCGDCGTPPGSINHPDAQILTPPYLLNADGSPATRPLITSAPIAETRLGARITVTTNSPVTSFVLMRLSSNTHTVANDQRRIPLSYVSLAAPNHYRLTIPSSSGVALPGYYMLFALNAKGVPSKSQTFRIH